MPAASAYLDECVDCYLVEALRKRGFTVTAARDEGMTEADDEEQLAYATARSWVLVSHNGKDFWRLHRSYQQRDLRHTDIAVLPVKPPLELLEIRVAMLLDWMVTFSERGSRFVRWGQLQAMLERGYRLPGYSEAEVRLALGR